MKRIYQVIECVDGDWKEPKNLEQATDLSSLLPFSVVRVIPLPENLEEWEQVNKQSPKKA